MHNTKYFESKRHATWLELFFDLILVVTIGDVTHILSHTHEGHLDPLQFWKFVLIFIPLWWVWASHTMYANRFDADDRKHRLATLFIMFLLIIISGLIGQRFLASFEAIVVCYVSSKYIIAMMYFVSKHRHQESVGLTTVVGRVILAGATISLASLLFPAPQQYVVFYLGILFDLLAFIFFLPQRLQLIPVHTEHLIVRVGLLTIIMLGESVISLSTGLADISWTVERLLTAATGFVMISSIWWVYFDSFHLLSEQKLTTGHSILYSHLFVFIGLSILANLIRHAILDDMVVSDFRVLSVIGAVCFFIGKQYGYFMERPELRSQLVVNTLVVFVLTGFALLLPRTGYILLGLTAAVICYAFLSLRYLNVPPRASRPSAQQRYHRRPAMSDTASSPDTMRGWVIRAYGEKMVLMDDLPVPTPGPHDILMQMRSAEVGDWDDLVRTGAWDMERPFPLILGLAGAGRIAAVGTAVTGFSENQQVYAYNYPLHDNGAWAEFMLVPETYVTPIPASLTPIEAGGVPIIGLTAHEALIDVLHVTGDDVMLINAAAGGVGHIAVQLASHLGAQVVATASRRNHDFVAGLGAASVIDYDATGDVAKAIRDQYPGGVDKALNCVSGKVANDYVAAVKDGGKIVDLPGAVSVHRPGVKIISDYVVRGNRARLADVTRLFDTGALRLVIHEIVPFDEAQHALDLVLSRHVRGKVVLRIT
ncbi:NADPH:quinone reductase-like Zn-dependent oxidoreductase [Paucimonas lemoignei]|uniref:NADPH:quinone reductase-like Zn-dependent oxidoreductase n=1 Tax=Paucimonas lemoignei TaxID=29443 RepID=A0A4R3HQK3_PAULE|nr:low temperature requirement protein A [Paucimonas lemoignei]TCS32579.1 NADPH:quinone reductase-like Zn-dependent oxidoreductase [Paucimonas lemoignei]